MGLWPVEREWVEFDGLSLGVRIRGNLTLAAQLYDLLVMAACGCDDRS